jgi:hypothetical protein
MSSINPERHDVKETGSPLLVTLRRDAQGKLISARRRPSTAPAVEGAVRPPNSNDGIIFL